LSFSSLGSRLLHRDDERPFSEWMHVSARLTAST
jgi:hypothetical protein